MEVFTSFRPGTLKSVRAILCAGACLLLVIAFNSPVLADGAGDPLYQKGLTDRGAWEQWFNSLQGDFKTGAFYWAGQRSLPHPGPCRQMDDDFFNGCTAAKERLASSDAMRNTEPAYKLGWNDWTPTAAAAPAMPASGSDDAIPRSTTAAAAAVKTVNPPPTAAASSPPPANRWDGITPVTTPDSDNALAPDPEKCKSDWSRCADNADIVNNYSNYSNAQVACKEAANARARYGDPVWPWLYFSTFEKGTDYVTSGTATLIEPDAEFQNGFGAMEHSRVICSYDLRAQQVVNLDVVPR
jgi:hypothetical protein